MPNFTPNYDFYLPLVNNATDQDLWGGYLNDNFTSLDSILSTLVPSGITVPFAGTSAPSGWLLCYGQAVSRTTYANLFTAISTTFGSGDGSTTFNLPDLRDVVVAGKGNMGGSDKALLTSAVSGLDGTVLGAIGGDQRFHTHTHTATATDSGHTHGIPQFAGNSGGGSNTNVQSSTTGGTTASGNANISVTVNNAGSGSSQNVQPTIILNYIIKT